MCLSALNKLSSSLPLPPNPPTTPYISSFVLSKPGHVTAQEAESLAQHGTKIRYGSHPVPDKDSEEATRDLRDYCESRPEGTLFLALVSGGTS
ncbi:hypothetical protein TrRE_jg12344, partial [Triparma retinervis]